MLLVRVRFIHRGNRRSGLLGGGLQLFEGPGPMALKRPWPKARYVDCDGRTDWPPQETFNA